MLPCVKSATIAGTGPCVYKYTYMYTYAHIQCVDRNTVIVGSAFIRIRLTEIVYLFYGVTNRTNILLLRCVYYYQ